MTSLSRIVCCSLLVLCCSYRSAQAQVDASLPDSDGDGIFDVWETMVYQTDPLQKDTDGDTFGDGLEISQGYNPKGRGLIVDADADEDGLNDRLELRFGTDPQAPDTNMDGILDGPQVVSGMSPTSTTPFSLGKSIHVSLAKQKLEPRVGGIAIAAYPISAGLPRTPTPLGTFTILQKSPRAWSSSAKLWMPYWMHFSGRGHGFHELPEWPNGRKEGENHLGKPASHGCVRMGIGTAKKIYDWAPVGTSVVISKL